MRKNVRVLLEYKREKGKLKILLVVYINKIQFQSDMCSLLPNLASLERLTGYSWTLSSHSQQIAAIPWKIFTPMVPISITAGHSHDHSCLIYLICGPIQCALHRAAFIDHSETSAGSEYGGTSSYRHVLECPYNTIASQSAQVTGRLLSAIQALVNKALYGTGPCYLRKPLVCIISAHPVTSDRMLQIPFIK